MSHWVASRVLWRPLHHSSFSLHPSLLVALALAFSILRNILQRKVIYGEGPVCVRRGSGETPMTLPGSQRRFGLAASMHSNALFPLTLTLSPRERELLSTGWDN